LVKQVKNYIEMTEGIGKAGQKLYRDDRRDW
jgi:hypothetical protein